MSSVVPQAVVFDLGGVLIHFEGFEQLPRLLDEELEPEVVRRRWIASPAVSAFERGELSAERFGVEFAREWNLRAQPEEFVEMFASWAKDFYPGARELVADVRSTCTTACFSNSNPIHWEKNFRLFGLQDAFDVCVASFEIGAVKPEHRAFELLLERVGHPADRVLFLDDTEVNVHAAREVGLAAERVHGVDEARSALVAARVLSA